MRCLEALWARTGRIQVADMANHFFLIRFSEDADYQRALFDGPWKIAVERIGNHIGRTIRLDLSTSGGARARYARVCVEVDLSRPLMGKYMIEDKVFYVEYESLDNICFTCGCYGHKDGSCPTSTPEEEAESAKELKETTITEELEGNSGSWMVVKRRQRKSVAKNPPESKQKQGSGSRFTVLDGSDAQPVMEHADLEEETLTRAAFDSEASKLAATLKAVLDKGVGATPTKSRGKGTVKGNTPPLKVLADITNKSGSGKARNPKQMVNKEVVSDGFVTILVLFGSSSFETEAPKLRAKPKGRPKANPSKDSLKVPNVSKTKKFGPKKPVVITPLAEQQDVNQVSTLAASHSGGRPPDLNL
ncbi:hypothetical protein LINPERHAP2_LOCUS4287 [Linum perenne]